EPTDEDREGRVSLEDNRSPRRSVLPDKHVRSKESPTRRQHALDELLLDRVDVSNDAGDRSVLPAQRLEPRSDRGPRGWISSALFDQLIEIGRQLAALAGRQPDRDRPIGLAKVVEVAPIRACWPRRGSLPKEIDCDAGAA